MSNQFTVNFTFENNKYSIRIECLDNTTINRWYESAKFAYQNPPVISLHHHPSHHQDRTRARDKEMIDKKYQELLDAIAGLELLGIKWPCEEPKEFNYDQQWCNRVHRYFTTLTMYRKFHIDLPEVINNRDPNIDKFYSLGHIINDAIHTIENYCVNETRQKFAMASKSILVNLPNIDYDIYKTHEWHRFTEEDYQYHAWEGDFNVIFEAEILGKSTYCSFGDEDDPDYFDTSGHHGWFGSFLIVTDDNRQKIYQTTEFNNWLESHGVSKQSPNIKGDFPIGKVIDWGTPDFRNIYKAKGLTNTSIVFHN